MSRPAALLLCLGFATPLLAQNPPASRGVTFDVVSIKPHPQESGIAGLGNNLVERPDGGITMINFGVGFIIVRAYGVGRANIVDLPGWANSERYDVNATASVPGATAEQRASMLRAMLADRFKLAGRVGKREQANYDLVLARRDGTLGSGIKPIESDCVKTVAERTAAGAANPQAGPRPMPDFKTPPQCSFRAQGDLLEGEGTMEMLANMLRLSAGRLVVDKTGLAGSYKVRLNYDVMSALRGPDVQPPDNAGPSVFVALQEQLGLKLEPSRTMVDTLIIDHIERPTEN